VTALDDLCGRRAGEVFDGLMTVLRLLVRAPGGRERVPGVVLELLGALQEQTESCEFATSSDGSGTLVAVRDHQSPAEAGASVGVSAAWVRKLCAGGHVRHQRVGRRGYLVDVDDLRRHLRGEAAS
jgi:hypothetical protein